MVAVRLSWCARLANLLKYSSVIISARHQNWLLYYLLILLGMLLDNRKHAERERDDVLGHKKRHGNSFSSSVKPEFPETRRGSSCQAVCADSMHECLHISASADRLPWRQI